MAESDLTGDASKADTPNAQAAIAGLKPISTRYLV
jgi:hypothetical protein